MGCDYCSQEIKEDRTNNNDCVLLALERIKNHYMFVKNAVNKRDEQLVHLQMRNDKLMRAVELLQKEKKRLALGSPTKRSPRKRRKANCTSTSAIDLSSMYGDQEEASSIGSAAVDDLNVAINSDEISDCSNDATYWSPPHNEIIYETEVLKSPRLLHSTLQSRRKLRDQNDENQKPVSTNMGAIAKTKTDNWMVKGKKPDLTKSASRIDSIDNFIKPISKMERNLSLKKPIKLKQTRLQLDVAREKSSSGSDTTYCEEIIGDSPNPNPLNKQTKPARSWLLRTSNNSINSSRNEEIEQTNQIDAIKFNSSDDEYFENVFKFAQDLTSSKNESFDKKSSPTEDLTKFPLREVVNSPDKYANCSNKIEVNNETTLESVMILSPTQEIIFLDDSCINTHIESMDLMQDMLKSGDESLEHLKRIENEKIKKLQKIASTVASKPQINPSKLSLNKSPPVSIPTTSVKEVKTITHAKIKEEKSTQPIIPIKDLQKSTTSKSKPRVSDESQDLMPLVKQESGEAKNTGIVSAQKSKLNIKEKFNIDCRDCQQYIDFIGSTLSEKEIIAHIQRCTRHQQRAAVYHGTPEGFWDPFIAPFDENDPRNETLIDTRFCDKK